MEDKLVPQVAFKLIDAISSVPEETSSRREDRYGFYRILIKSSTIKYLAYLDTPSSIADLMGRRLGIQTVPEGDWNIGHLIADQRSNKLVLDFVEKKSLAAISCIWHSNFVDYLDLQQHSSGLGIPQSECSIYSFVSHNHFGVENVVVNFEWFPNEIYAPAVETEIYKLIEGHGIGPRFVSHLTENHDRVIGYVVEQVDGHYATHDDLDACREVLSKLHKLGIAYGHLDSKSFLVHKGAVLLHRFTASYQTQDTAKLDTEMRTIENALSLDAKI